MQIEREDLNPCTIKLSVKCAPDQVEAGFNKAYKTISKRVRVPGFRPGTAPKAVLAGMVDKNALYETAAEEIVKLAITDALKKEDIKPHEPPTVDVQKLNEDENECEFVAKVPLEPKVELGEYKGVEVTVPKQEVTDKEVEEFLEKLRKGKGKRETVTDRGIQEGDMCVVNLKVDGEEGDGKNFMSVAGETFKALDKALVGMKVEEMKVAELSFPKDFQVKEMAGKKAKVQITIRSVSTMAMPDLDDDFAKEAAGELKSESVDELKAKVKERMLAAKMSLHDEFLNESIQETILKNSTVHVPDTMWEAVANQRLREIAGEAQQAGKKIEEVAEEAGMSVEEMVEKWKAEAKVQVQRAVVANTIFKQENLKLTNQDYNDVLMVMARDYQTDPRTLFAFLQKNKALYEVEVRAVYGRTMKFLRDNAKIVEAN